MVHSSFSMSTRCRTLYGIHRPCLDEAARNPSSSPPPLSHCPPSGLTNSGAHDKDVPHTPSLVFVDIIGVLSGVLGSSSARLTGRLQGIAEYMPLTNHCHTTTLNQEIDRYQWWDLRC